MPVARFSIPTSTILVISSILILPVLLTESGKAYACEVGPWGPPDEALENSAAVFSGKVAEFENIAIEGVGDRRVASFEVDRYWKAPNENDYKELIVITEIDHGACGYDFEKGKSYLVYATAWSYDTSSLSTSIGTRTQPIEDAQQDLSFLGEGKVPTKQLSWDGQLNRITIQPIPTGQEQQAISTILSIVGIGAILAGAVTFFSLRKLRAKK